MQILFSPDANVMNGHGYWHEATHIDMMPTDEISTREEFYHLVPMASTITDDDGHIFNIKLVAVYSLSEDEDS